MVGVVYPSLIAFACETEDVELSEPLRAIAVALTSKVHAELDGVWVGDRSDIAALARVVGRALLELADTYEPPEDE